MEPWGVPLSLRDPSGFQPVHKLFHLQRRGIGRTSAGILGSPSPLLVVRPPTWTTLSQLPPRRHLTGRMVCRGPTLGRPLPPGTSVPQPYLVILPLPILGGTVRSRLPRHLTKEKRAWSLPYLPKTRLIRTPTALGSLQKGRSQDLGGNTRVGASLEGTPLALPCLGWVAPVALGQSPWWRVLIQSTLPLRMCSPYPATHGSRMQLPPVPSTPLPSI